MVYLDRKYRNKRTGRVAETVNKVGHNGNTMVLFFEDDKPKTRLLTGFMKDYEYIQGQDVDKPIMS